jgi:phosphoribosylaminoimidazolecarboxamide formyltransferase/IMP cyclohydrolase
MAYALLSVSDKRNLVPFAQTLIEVGYELVSTGGTFSVLQAAGLPVVTIDSVTGFPEMLDGRVKTLHPKVHGGLLAKRHDPAHQEACLRHQIKPIDMVVVNLYPFEATIAKPDVTLEDAIENIDIGGPSMVRSAAKNHESVAVVVNPDRYFELMEELKANQGQLSVETRQRLTVEAFEHTSRYDAIIAGYLRQVYLPESKPLLDQKTLILDKKMDLRYGENPHQKAAFYHVAGSTHASPIQHQGKELSYNNLLDLDAAWQLVKALPGCGAAIIKHNNPCGVAVSETLVTAYQKALSADPVSAFGGIVGLNREVDADTASELAKLFLEVIVAPSFSSEALSILSAKEAVRLISIPQFEAASDTVTYRQVQGGFLAQTPDTQAVDSSQWTRVTTTQPSAASMADMELAWEVVRHVKSNAIVVVKEGKTLGIGAGQMSRIEAVEIALKKAGPHAIGAVLASDAFFPFKDSVILAAKAGITAVVQPGGSKKDQESIDQCNEDRLAMVFTHVRHFKH